jgi:hypothetical protein
LVARQLISTTRPIVPGESPYWIHSPTSNGRCAWIDSPAKRLPSVSCMDRPITAVSNADVVRSALSSAPAARSVASTAAV